MATSIQEDYHLLQEGFKAGFAASFDGWNGQVFKEFNRSFLESEIFCAKMEEALLPILLRKYGDHNAL